MINNSEYIAKLLKEFRQYITRMKILCQTRFTISTRPGYKLVMHQVNAGTTKAIRQVALSHQLNGRKSKVRNWILFILMWDYRNCF